jgi:hypothetical protein
MVTVTTLALLTKIWGLHIGDLHPNRGDRVGGGVRMISGQPQGELPVRSDVLVDEGFKR